MRRLGLLGGTTYHSSLAYYRAINELVQERTEGRDYASLCLESVNFGEIIRNNARDDQDANRLLFVQAAKQLHAASANALVLCANTPHMFAPAITEATGLPILHIADGTTRAIKEAGITRVGLLGTKFTMELDIYHSRLEGQGIECLTPTGADADAIHSAIYSELARGDFSERMKALHLGVISRLIDRGAQGVILGCTEIPLLLSPIEIPVPSFDTTRLHCQAAVDFALS